MKIRVERSEKWLTDRQVETGKNVDRYLAVELDPRELSVDSRKAVVACYGGYPDQIESLWYGTDYEWNRHSGYGNVSVKIDSESPTAAEIDAAIRRGIAEVEAKRAKAAEEKEERERQEQGWRNARELLKDEFAKMQAEIDGWKERYDSRRAELYVVSEFLSAVPEDALRGTLKAVCSSEEQIAAKRKQVEDASPVVIFADDEE